MTENREERYVGVVADGGTDRDIILHIAQDLMSSDNENVRFVPVPLPRQSMRDHVEDYWYYASRSDDYSLSSFHARELIKRVVVTLRGALNDFFLHARRSLTDQDLIVVNTDAERKLSSAERYFDDWAAILSKLILFGIERFYHDLVLEGYRRQDVPFVVPLILFPSTDIIVAAARLANGSPFQGYGKSPRELKREIYGTDDLRRIAPEDFRAIALSCMNEEGFSSIYRYVPDSRLFLHTLAMARA